MAERDSGKLVRDRIPEIVRRAGAVPVVRVLEPGELFPALIRKLYEEADELGSASPADRLEELADLHEVLLALAAASGLTPEEVAGAVRAKRAERGGFERRLMLTRVLTPGAGSERATAAEEQEGGGEDRGADGHADQEHEGADREEAAVVVGRRVDRPGSAERDDQGDRGE